MSTSWPSDAVITAAQKGDTDAIATLLAGGDDCV
jgi:hypothetical protein